MRRQKILFRVAIGAVLFGACIYLVAGRRDFSTGQCSSMAELPWFGANLPQQDLGHIEYIAERKHRRVLAKMAVTSVVFEDIAAKMDLSVVRYTKGFSDVELATVNKTFRPTGTNVWFGFGRLSKNGRSTIRLYFEPAQNNADVGTLYIHVS